MIASWIDLPQEPYFPIGTNKRTLYSEIVKCLASLGYKIQVSEEEYKTTDTARIPALCPKNHGLTHVNIWRLRNGDSCCKKCGEEKVKATNLRIRGVENPLSDPLVRKKMRETNLERYDVEYPAQNPQILEKMKETSKKNNSYEKMKETNLERYGVEHVSQDPSIREKAKETLRRNWGVNFPMQNAEIRAKQLESNYLRKLYTFPSGRIIYLQGYEPFCLDELLKEGYIETQIYTDTNDKMPEIWYYFDDKPSRYFPDIFIAEKNLIIEVKSTYTYELNKEKNLAKAQACKKLGYSFEFRIYDPKGKPLEKIIIGTPNLKIKYL